MSPTLNQLFRKYVNINLIRLKATEFLISTLKMYPNWVVQLFIYLLRFKKLLRRFVVTVIIKKKVLNNLLLTLILVLN